MVEKANNGPPILPVILLDVPDKSVLCTMEQITDHLWSIATGLLDSLGSFPLTIAIYFGDTVSVVNAASIVRGMATFAEYLPEILSIVDIVTGSVQDSEDVYGIAIASMAFCASDKRGSFESIAVRSEMRSGQASFRIGKVSRAEDGKASIVEVNDIVDNMLVFFEHTEH